MEGKSELEQIADRESAKASRARECLAADKQWLDKRMFNAKMNRYRSIIQESLRKEQAAQQKKDHAAIYNEQVRKEIALAQALEEEKGREAVELAKRIALREKDPELRNLLRKIENGYVCRDLKKQIEYNEFKRTRDKMQELQSDILLLNKVYTDEEFDMRKDKEKLARCQGYRKSLLDQIRFSEEATRIGNERDIELERKNLAGIMQKYKEKDESDLAAATARKELLREEAASCLKARKEELMRQAEERAAMEEYIAEQARIINARTSNEKQEKLEKLRIKDEINMRIAKDMMEAKREKEDYANMCTELSAMEFEEKVTRKEFNDKLKIMETEKKNFNFLMKQVQDKKAKEKHEKEMDLLLKETIDHDVAKAQAKEDEKQRLKWEGKRRYREDLLQQMEENAVQKKNDKQDDLLRAEGVQKYFEETDARIQAEREIIIREHIPRVFGCLPRKSLDYRDVPILASLSKEHDTMTSLDINKIGELQDSEKYSKCNKQCLRLREY